MAVSHFYPVDYSNHSHGDTCRKMGNTMSEFQFGKRQQDTEDVAAVLAVLKENEKLLEDVTRSSHMNYRRIITLAIRHFASLSLEEQWELLRKYSAE